MLLKALFRVSALTTTERSAEECMNWLVAARGICRNDDEHKWLLEAIGDVRCEEAVEKLVLPALEDDALVSTACAAAVKMICSRGGKDAGLNGDASRKALEAVVAKTADDNLRKKAEAQLREMLTAEGAEERKMRAAYAF